MMRGAVGQRRPATGLFLSHQPFNCCKVARTPGFLVCRSRPAASVTCAAGATVADAAQQPVDIREPSAAEAKPARNRKLPSRAVRRAPAGDGVVTVYEKPASKYLLQQLQQAPEATLQAGIGSKACVYTCIQTVAAANGMLEGSKESGQLLYVPASPAPLFACTVVKTSQAAVAPRTGTEALTVSSASSPDALSRQLLSIVLRGNACTLKAAGPAAVSAAVRAVQLARRKTLEAGYELGVWPSYVRQPADDGNGEVTLLQQQVVRQELPALEVSLPAKKNLQPAIAAAQKFLQQQKRVQLLVPGGARGRLPEVLQQLQGERERQRLLLMLPVAAAGEELGANFSLQLRTSRWTSLAAAQQLPSKPFFVTSTTSADNLAAALSAQIALQEVVDARTDGSTAAASALVAAVTAVNQLQQAEYGTGVCALLQAQAPGAADGAAAAVEGSGESVHAASTTTASSGTLPAAAAGAGEAVEASAAPSSAATPASAAEPTSGAAGAGEPASGAAGAVPQQGASSPPGGGAAAPGQGVALHALVARRSEVALHVLQAPNRPLQVTCQPDYVDALLKAAAALNALTVYGPSGRGGLLVAPALLPSGELQLRCERLGMDLRPGLEDPSLQDYRVSHSTQPDALRGACLAAAAQRTPTQLVLAVGGAASWRALMGVAVARLELAQRRQQRMMEQQQKEEAGGGGGKGGGVGGLLPELLGVLVMLDRDQMEDGSTKQMYHMRLVWQQ